LFFVFALIDHILKEKFTIEKPKSIEKIVDSPSSQASW